ncbi:exonuclease VII small subunit domain-containing protein [Fusarium mexicanum]|uniref:Exonuclease VII small subunit domain-containing protein n=1 Tax=Fusarium mexicanum TaxID=751941 RepID=A0A8H5JEZ7_9HYPO|nr:exonuclease VII small subunit domain-containing protein [Fusarium mexicanum]
MATAQLSALQDIEAAQKSLRMSKYGGRMSNQFVDEVKEAALFQFNWGELLGAAPTAIAMMCACYTAASNDEAQKIFLTDSVPIGGFQYLTNRKEPTLRASLIDVCESGGKEAFGVAGARMENLKQYSFAIMNEHIPEIFQFLEICSESEENLDDMRRALKRFVSTANSCAKYAAEIHLAFNKWSKMVIKLHGAAEQESGTTALKSSKTSLDKQLAEIQKASAEKTSKRTDEEVKRTQKSLEKAEKRLDRALDNVPGPWATVIQSAASSFAQALPAITAAALPIALASANPLGAAAGGVLGQNRAPIVLQPNGLAQQPGGSTFFAFLGGYDEDMDWTKFDVSEANAESEDPSTKKQSGIIWLLGQLQGELADVPKTETEAAKKLAAAFNRAISVANEIKQHIEKGTSLKSERASVEVVNNWKAAVKTAKNDVLTLSAASGSTASVNSPNPFTRPSIEVPKPDLSARKL